MSPLNAFHRHVVPTLDVLCGGLWCLGLRLGFLGRGLGLGVLFRLLDFLGGTDGLVSLSLPQLWLLVALGEDLVEGSTNDGPLELVCPLGALLGSLLFNTLPVLTPVKHSPGHLTRVPLQKVSFFASAIQKSESLAVGFDVG